MKNKFKLVLPCLLASVMLAGCGEQESSTPLPSDPASSTPSDTGVVEEQALNLLSKVEDGGDGVYNVTASETQTSISYTKEVGKEWTFAKVDLAGTDLSKYASLRFKVSGTQKIILKIESSKGAGELTLQLKDSGSFEWCFADTDVFLTNDAKIIIFGLPGASEGSDTMVFDELSLRTEMQEDSTYSIMLTGGSNIVNTVNEYNGTDATFNVNNHWAENDANTYKYEYKDDGSVVVNSSTSDWQFAKAPIQGDKHGKFGYLNIKVQGDEGDAVLFKVESNGNGAVEGKVEFTGGIQEVYLDLTAQYADAAARGTIFQVLMFAAPGEKNEDGSKVKQTFTVLTVEFAEAGVGAALNGATPNPDPQPPVEGALTYTGVGKEFGVQVNSFKDGGDGVYTVGTNDRGLTTLTYDKPAGKEWASAYVDIAGKWSDFAAIQYMVEVPAGKQILLKIEGNGQNIEHWVTGNADGSAVTGKMDLNKDAAILDGMTKLLVFAEGGSGDVKGEVALHYISFVRGQAAVAENGAVDLAGSSAYAFDPNTYVVSNDASGVKIDTTPDQTSKGAYTFIGFRIAAPEGKYSKLTFTVSGDAANSLLVKLESENGGGAKEGVIEALGDKVTFTLDVSGVTGTDHVHSGLMILFVANPGKEVPHTGTIVIESAVFSN